MGKPWQYHGRTTGVNPRNAYEALNKIGQLVREGEGETADVTLGQLYNAIKNGADADMNDELQKRLENNQYFRRLVEQCEERHIHFLIDQGHIFDRGSGEEHRKLSLSNQGRSVIDHARNQEAGKARRLFIEALEGAQANTFRHGAETKNKTGKGVRPMKHLARTLLESEQNKLDRHQAAEALFSSTDPEEAATRLDEITKPGFDDQDDDSGDHDNLSGAKALFKEVVHHPAFYDKGQGDEQTLCVRDETALEALAEHPDGITPEQYQSMDREVGRIIQGQPGLRMVDLQQIDGIGETTERRFYESLSEACRTIDGDGPEQRQDAVQSALDRTIDDQLPANVNEQVVRNALISQDHGYEKLYHGELQSMRRAVTKMFEENLDIETSAIRNVLENVLQDEPQLLAENIDFLLGDGSMQGPPSYKEGYEALLGCEGFSKRLYYERARKGMVDEQIGRILKGLNNDYNGRSGVENAIRLKDDLRNPYPEQSKALQLEDIFGLSLVSMAEGADDQAVTRNLRTAWTPYGEYGQSFAPGKNADVSVELGDGRHFTAEVTGLSRTRDLFKKEVEPIMHHGETYAEKQDLDPGELPILFVAPAGLDADSRVVEGLISAYHSSTTNFNTNPAPIDLEMYIEIFEAVKQNNTSLDDVYEFLQQLGETFETYVRYDYPVSDWVRQVRAPVIEHLQQDGTIDTEDGWEVKLPISRHGDHETEYCTAQSSELSELTYETILGLYEDELDVDIEPYKDDGRTAKNTLKRIVYDVLGAGDMFDRLSGETVLTPPGFRYLLREHRETVEETVERTVAAQQNQKVSASEQKKGGSHDEETKQLNDAMETIEGLLNVCSEEVLKDGGDINFQIELQFWQERISKIIQEEAEAGEVEQGAFEALAEKEQFAEWVAGLGTIKQKRAALHGMFVGAGNFGHVEEDIEGAEFDRLEVYLERGTVQSYQDIQEELGIPGRDEYKKWREVDYWRRNFPDLFKECVGPMLDGQEAMSYEQFLRKMSVELKKRIEVTIKEELGELVEQHSGEHEAVYDELKEQFEDEILQQLIQQAEAVLNRPIDPETDGDKNFKDQLEAVVNVMASEAERSFDLEKLDTSELRSYYEQLRKEFERSAKEQVER